MRYYIMRSDFTLCVKCVTLCGYKMYYIIRKSYYVMLKLLRYAKNVLRYAAIITLCVVITLCGVTHVHPAYMDNCK